MDYRAYWIWLQHAFGEGSPLPWQLSRRFHGGAAEFHEGGPRLWNSLSFLSDQQAAALYDFTLGEAEARLEYAEKVGWFVLTPECEKYPEALRNISDPPAVLYGKGRLPEFGKGPAVAVAGARKALQESVAAARKIGYQLAAGGALVVSGGAVGIDSASLAGAMSASGRVISVLPVDLNSPYLAKNASLRQEIPKRGGALLSEYFTQRNPAMGGFQTRNRLITGLCDGVVLIQAAMKSGTIIYARHAADQNRDVFVYPGPAGAAEYAGSQALLRDGAKAVSCGEDVLEDYALRFPLPRKEPACLPDEYEGIFDDICLPEREAVLADSAGRAVSFGPGLSPEEEKVMSALQGHLLTAAQLGADTGIPAGRLLGLLTEMELEGLVESVSGKRYRRLRR